MSVSTNNLDRMLDLFDLPTHSWVVGPKVSRYSQTSDDNAYTIMAPMIGVTKTDLSVNITNNTLIVSATPSNKSRWSNGFKQSWILSEDADVNNINAKLENGLLTLTIPRVKPASRIVNVTIQ